MPGRSDESRPDGLRHHASGGAEEAGTSTLALWLHERDDVCVISMRGELDLLSAPPLRELLATVFSQKQPQRLVLDLKELIYLDSTGLSVFVTAQKRAAAAGVELSLVDPNPSVRRLFEITALDRIFTILDPEGSSGSSGHAGDESNGVRPGD
jgi:anti-sigma B factor antagonist